MATRNYQIGGISILKQETNQWCWAACGRMIMQFLGNDVSQCSQADHFLNLTNSCNSPVPQESIKPGWPQFGDYGFNADHTAWGTPLTWEEIVTEINANRPIAWTKAWVGGGGHMLVGWGYQETDSSKMVKTIDPWTGALVDYTYEAYVGQANTYTHGSDVKNIHKRAASETETSAQLQDEQHHDASQDTGEGGPITFSDPVEAASFALGLLPSLVHEDTFRAMGLSENIDSTDSLALGAPIPVQYIRADDLDNFDLNEDPIQILGEPEELVFPVIEKRNIATSIVVTRNSEGSYQFVSIGRSELIRSIMEVYMVNRERFDKSHEEFFLVHIPHVYHMFLAHIEDGTLMLSTIFDIPEKGIPRHETFVANELLHILADMIIGNPGGISLPGR